MTFTAHFSNSSGSCHPFSVATRRFLLSPVDQTDSDAGGPPPSLPKHYLGSALLRGGPPLKGRFGTFGLAGPPLGPFPFRIAPAGSQVPHASPEESHAPYTPDTAGPRGRLPSCSSRGSATTPVLMSSCWFFDASAGVRFHSSLSPSPDGIFVPPFNPDVHDRGFWPKPLRAV